MKKQQFIKLSLAAAAVFGALAGNASAEGVTVFGIADVGVMSTKAPDGSRSTIMQSGGMTTSAIGFKGDEDLGGGMKADFAASSFINFGTGAVLGGIPTANLFAREAWVGLGGNFGHVSLGRDVNPSFLPIILFNAYGDSTVYSPLWHATYFDFNGSTGRDSQSFGLFNDTAWDNQIRYTSPSLGGATVDVSYAMAGAGKSNFGTNVMYFNGPLGLAAFYMDTRTNSTGSTENDIYGTNDSAKTYFVGGSYDFGFAKAFATYQEGSQKAAGTKAKTLQLSAAIPAGPGKVLVEYAGTRFEDGGLTKYSQTAVGYDYMLSKRTDLYANYLYMKDDSAASNGSAVGVGVRHTF